MNNQILSEVDKIIEFIKESDDYEDYIYLKDKLSKHEEANNLITEIKKLQKQAVKQEVNKMDTKELDNKIKENLDKLNKIPLYRDFIDKQEVLNDYYQTIKERLDEYFYNKMN